MNEITHTVGTVTVAALQTNPGVPYKNPGDVDFIVKYPEGYSGPRHMPEGPVVTSKESAELFTKLGIGSVAGSSDEKPAETADQNLQPAMNYDKLNKELLKAELTKRSIEFNDSAIKADLIALLTDDDSKKAGSSDEKPAE
jgi:hypothetical protein